MKRKIFLYGVLCSFLASGCAKKEIVKPEAEAANSLSPAISEQKPKDISGSHTANQVAEVEGLPAPVPEVKPVAGGELSASAIGADGSLSRIYFDFDSYLLTAESRDLLFKNATILRDNPSKKLVIAGHCDERGSDEYNLALGEKRAQAAVKYLQSLGIEAARLSFLSFGEEKPADPGQNDAAWHKNRRDELRWQ